MGIFDTIGAALSGQPAQPAATAKAKPKGDWNLEREIHIRENAARGYDQYGDPLTGTTPGTSSGMDAALQKHADKIHPVKGR